MNDSLSFLTLCVCRGLQSVTFQMFNSFGGLRLSDNLNHHVLSLDLCERTKAINKTYLLSSYHLPILTSKSIHSAKTYPKDVFGVCFCLTSNSGIYKDFPGLVPSNLRTQHGIA